MTFYFPMHVCFGLACAKIFDMFVHTRNDGFAYFLKMSFYNKLEGGGGGLFTQKPFLDNLLLVLFG